MTPSALPFLDKNDLFKTHRLPVAILLFICFWSFFYNTGLIEMDSMEARNLQTAREMVDGNNWLVPTMNGEIRLAKPPLPTWFAALVSVAAGGTDELSLLRIPNALAATLLVLFAYGMSWTISRDRSMAFMVAAILATNFLMMRLGHKATWDIFCHSFMLGALWAFIDGVRNNRGWPQFALCGALMGLSFMSKGPVSFFSLLLPFTLSYLWIFRPSSVAEKWHLIALAFALCIVISGLWPLFIWNFHPEAMLTMAEQESDAWVNKHLQEFWYYSNFISFSGVWLVVTLAALFKPFAERRFKSVHTYRFLLLWLVLQILLLSLVPEKKTRYLLPTLIPLAMLGGMLFREIALRFAQGTQGKGDLRVITLHTVLISLFGILFPLFLLYQLDQVDKATSTLYLVSLCAVFLTIVAVGWWLFLRKSLHGLFLLTVLQFCFIALFYMDSYREVGISNPEYKTMTHLDQARLPADIEIFAKVGQPEVKFAWDLKRRVQPWDLERILQLIESGHTIALISVGDPYVKLARKVDREIKKEIVVTMIDRFDYNETSAEKEKIFLSLVRLKQ